MDTNNELTRFRFLGLLLAVLGTQGRAPKFEKGGGPQVSTSN